MSSMFIINLKKCLNIFFNLSMNQTSSIWKPIKRKHFEYDLGSEVKFHPDFIITNLPSSYYSLNVHVVILKDNISCS